MGVMAYTTSRSKEAVYCRCNLDVLHRHLGVVEVGDRLMGAWFFPTKSGTWVRVSRGLPLGARFLAVERDKERLVYSFLFESPEFPAVVDGELVRPVRVEMEELFIPS